jgi:hypothetical protein
MSTNIEIGILIPTGSPLSNNGNPTFPAGNDVALPIRANMRTDANSDIGHARESTTAAFDRTEVVSGSQVRLPHEVTVPDFLSLEDQELAILNAKC